MNVEYIRAAFTRRAIPIWLAIAVLVPVFSLASTWLGEKNRLARLAQDADYEWAMEQCLKPESGHSQASCDCVLATLRERELETEDLKLYVAVGFANQTTDSINLVTDIMRLNLDCAAEGRE